MEELKCKVGLRVAEKIIIFEIYQTSINTCIMLQNVVSNVIRIGFDLYFFGGDIYLPSSCLLASLLLRDPS